MTLIRALVAFQRGEDPEPAISPNAEEIASAAWSDPGTAPAGLRSFQSSIRKGALARSKSQAAKAAELLDEALRHIDYLHTGT